MMTHSTPSTHGAASERAFEHSDVSWQTSDRRGGERRSQERRSQPRRGNDEAPVSVALRQEIEEHKKLATELRQAAREIKAAMLEFRRDREIQTEIERQSAQSLREVAKCCREALLRATDENREVKAEMRDSLKELMDVLQGFRGK